MGFNVSNPLTYFLFFWESEKFRGRRGFLELIYSDFFQPDPNIESHGHYQAVIDLTPHFGGKYAEAAVFEKKTCFYYLVIRIYTVLGTELVSVAYKH